MKTTLRAAAILVALCLPACTSNAGPAPDASDTASPETSESAAATSEPEEAVTRESLTVATLSPSHVTWAHTFVAQALGYFDDEALDVEIVTNLPLGTANDALLTGQLDIAGVTQAHMLPFMAQNPDELQYFMMDNNYPFDVMVPEDSEIDAPEDLVGGIIGMREASDEVIVDFIMASSGIAADQYEKVATGGRAAAGVALIDGRVDAVMGTFVDRAAIQNDAGLPVRALASGTEHYYNGGYATTTQMLEESPDVVARFGRAVAKGAVWMYENPEATVDVLAELVPEAITDRDAAIALRETWNEADRSLYEARFDTDPAVWQEMIDAYVATGTIAEAFPAERVFTSALIEEIWDFDVDAVVDAARNDER